MKSIKSITFIILVVSAIAFISGCQTDSDHSGIQRARGRKNPAFTYISSNWRSRPYKIRMDDIWQDEGIDATGQNYYFFPRPAPGHKYSERFNPLSDYFQAWFGMYTIEDADNTTYALSENGIDAEAIIGLAIADQNAWLRSYGCSQPLVTLDTSMPLSVTEIEIDGSSGWKITGRINTNVDVGVDNPRLGLPSLPKVPPTAWQGLIESYGSVSLDVVSYVWHALENKELNVVYYSAVEFDDLNDAHHRTLPLISTELDSMALSITVYK